jgi:hypothetical protein
MLILTFVIFLLCLIFSLVITVGIHVILTAINKNTEDILAVERFVDISLDVSEQISYLMIKYQITPTELCNKLNITTNTLNSWLSGVYDFKLSQLTRLEAVFNEYIITSTLIKRKKIKPD